MTRNPSIASQCFHLMSVFCTRIVASQLGLMRVFFTRIVASHCYDDAMCWVFWDGGMDYGL